jgi:MFS transporter, OFA family, oxalate/formate antiporter
MTPQTGSTYAAGLRNRWVQLGFMVLSTVMLSNMQYGWTLFVNPMHDARHWEKAGIQLAFTIMIFVNTWLSPVEGWFVDRYGPRPVVMAGGLFTGLSWMLNARATSLPILYTAAVIGGLGVGCVFGTCMGTALKWFPDKRGLAAGMIAAGFALGAGITVIPVAGMIRSSGYQQTFFTFGLIQGLSIFVLGLFLIKPITTKVRSTSRNIVQSARNFRPAEVVRTPAFWMIYLVYVAIASGGMVITAQLGPIARDFGLEKQMLVILGSAVPLLTLTISIDNFANGLTRPLSGFLSDAIGRENAMLLIFGCEAVAFVGLATLGHHPVAFVVFAAMIFLFWGEVFSIFPAICGDTFGVEHAAANNGLLYTAKGTSALLVPVASLLVGAAGNWSVVLIAFAAFSLFAGVMAKLVLAPMRKGLLKPPSGSSPSIPAAEFGTARVR